jgi:nitrite reductase/ring-hydroxylating ferredoxin subunit
MKSNALKKNSSRAVRAFGRDWLVFRGADGKPGVIDRYCCHMGADLLNGKVVGDSVECALHGWHFDGEGQCRKIPALKNSDVNQLSSRRQNRLPCQDAFGVIFVYFGESAEFDIPLPAGMPSVIWSTSHEIDLDTEHHAPCLNTFDVQHYRTIHHRVLVDDPVVESADRFHLGIDMNTRVLPINVLDRFMKWLVKGEANIIIDCWGASLLVMSNSKTGYGSIIGMLPVEKKKTRIFIIPVKGIQAAESRPASLSERFQLLVTAWLVKGFLQPDKRILSGMRPVRGCLLDGYDDIASTYWDFYMGLPVFGFEEQALPVMALG